MKNIEPIKNDEITIYDFFLNEIDWDAMDKQQRSTLEIVFLGILACVENKQINTDKLAAIVSVISSGKFGFKPFVKPSH